MLPRLLLREDASDLQKELQGKYFRSIVQRIKNDVSSPVFVFQERKERQRRGSYSLKDTVSVCTEKSSVESSMEIDCGDGCNIV